jgi:hypothetical protein
MESWRPESAACAPAAAVPSRKKAPTASRFFKGEILLVHVSGLMSWWRLDASSGQGTFLRSDQVSAVYDESDCGLIAVAFDPGFPDNRVPYAGYCTGAKSSRVTASC